MAAEVKALRNVTVQNRMALDLTLAASGGVCHVIGAECCTYVPDYSDNMTHVVSYLNDLLASEKALDLEEARGFNLWT